METRSGGGMLHTENEKVEEGGMLISCCLILGVNRTTWTWRRARSHDHSQDAGHRFAYANQFVMKHDVKYHKQTMNNIFYCIYYFTLPFKSQGSVFFFLNN